MVATLVSKTNQAYEERSFLRGIEKKQVLSLISLYNISYFYVLSFVGWHEEDEPLFYGADT